MKPEIHIWFGLTPALFVNMAIIPMVSKGLLQGKMAANDK